MNFVNDNPHNTHSNHCSQCEYPCVGVKGHDKCEIVISFWRCTRHKVKIIWPNRSNEFIFEVMSMLISMFGHGYVYFSVVQLKQKFLCDVKKFIPWCTWSDTALKDAESGIIISAMNLSFSSSILTNMILDPSTRILKLLQVLYVLNINDVNNSGNGIRYNNYNWTWKVCLTYIFYGPYCANQFWPVWA